MNWRLRRKIAKQQMDVNEIYPSGPIGGVLAKDNGKVIHLNDHPKTDWKKEFEIATNKLFKRKT